MEFDLTQPFSARSRGGSISALFAEQFAKKKKKEVSQGWIVSSRLVDTFVNDRALNDVFDESWRPTATQSPPLPRRHCRGRRC